jgi:ADP-dependent phosphofructokinase/glucokinase
VLGGFNLLLDRVKHLRPKELEQLIRETGIDLRTCCATPKQHSAIHNLRELVELLVACIVSSDSKEVPVVNRDVREWLNNTWAKSCKLRPGGQPSYMALAACSFVPRIVLAGWPTPARFAELIPPNIDNIHMAVYHRGKMQVKPVHDCKDLPGYDHANCVIDFSADLEVSVDSSKLKSRRPGRFIANCFPRGEWMKTGTSKHLKSSGTQSTHAFLSGCQSLCPDVDSDTLWREQISEFATTIRGLRNGAGCRAVHYEMGTIHSVPLLETLVKELFPTVDSIGCNEVELVSILEAVGEKDLASRISAKMSIVDVYRGAFHLVQLCELQRLHVHTWHFHVSVSRAGVDTHVVERDALLFGAVMGAAKTCAQLDIQDTHIQQGLEIPFSEDGISQVRKLHEKPEAVGTYIADGIFQTDDDALVCIVPGRVKPDLDSTVGLGDTLSSMAFLAAAG